MQQLLGPGLGHPPVPWPQAPPSQFRHFSPLISGPSIHCPQSSDGETEAREQKSRVGSGQGASGSWSGILLALPRGTEPLVPPFDPPLLSGSRRPAVLGMAQTGWFCRGWEQLTQLWGPPKPGAGLWRLKATVIGVSSRIPNLSRAGEGLTPKRGASCPPGSQWAHVTAQSGLATPHLPDWDSREQGRS